MFRTIAALAAVALLAAPAFADGLRTPVETREAFLSLVKDRALTRFGITLNVTPDGRITGRAFGRTVTGNWEWQGRYFCRDLFYGDEPLGPNCQTVELRGDALRFTADQGQGIYADLRLR